MYKNRLHKIFKLDKKYKKIKAPTGPHSSEGMAGDYVWCYVMDSAAHMGTKHTIKDVYTICIAL